ncbi:hypothetical protein [Paracoccus rhizosphaerae]|uniref:General stress protein 17M-like domain-containing protein n=1 Tax=Paracoccus rhizosphaerae TaxID=1133347 RepID=A0ABV6CPL1_9RHOB|nr:hypothetical protein [Paracoccus rhizosphaerae]
MTAGSHPDTTAGRDRLVLAVFDEYQEAEDARAALREAGLPAAKILRAPQDLSPSATDEPALPSGLSFPDADQHALTEALSRGAAAVLAEGLTNAEATQAVAILSAMPAVDMNRREAEWRDDGWTGLSQGTLPDPVRGTTRDMAYTNPRDDDADTYESPSVRPHQRDEATGHISRDTRGETPRVRCYVANRSA